MSCEETNVAPPPLPSAAREPESSTTPDWTRREFALHEWMDGPCTYADYKRGALDLERVNRLTLGYRPVLRFLERVMEHTGVGHEPLHIVDVGCGHGDGLRNIHRWAARRSIPLRLTGVDVNPYAARLARERDRNEDVSAGTIAWVTADAFAATFDQPVDIALSSLFTHHLSDTAIENLLRWNDATARVGWMVNDLRRSERAATGFKWLTRAIGSCAMVKHDGAVSFRRALTIEEWRERCRQAGVDAQVMDIGLGRLRIERIKFSD